MNHKQDLSVLFLCKKDNVFAERAAEFIRKNFKNSLIFSGTRKDPLPPEVLNWSGDLLISFISSWIIPNRLLEQAGVAAINFHPGSPDYPGTGCTNFAFYNGETEYGVTGHHMKAVVDTGKIIAVRRFKILPDDSVFSVTQRCYEEIEGMFYDIMDCILQDRPLPESAEKWTRKPYTRKQLDALCEVDPTMSEEEIERRIKATTYKHPWAFTRIGTRIFKLQQ
jgi:methionyl-tRNA formyltransferase